MVIGRGRRREHLRPTFCTTTKKKARGKPGMRRTYFGQGLFRLRQSDVTSGHFRSKCPTRAGIAQLPVAHAQNILPDMASSGDVIDVSSGHVTSSHVTSGSTTTTNTT